MHIKNKLKPLTVMKIIFTLFLGCLFTFSAVGQTYTSTMNGNWTNPMTWTPTGVPLPGSTVIINHDVTLNTAYAYSSGSIIINSGGSLMQDGTGRDISMSGTAVLTNDGALDIRNMLFNAGTTFTNNGTATIASFANFATINNAGSIQQVDSLYNDGTLTNNGLLRVATFYTNDVLNNYGEIRGKTGMVDSMTNAGTMNNYAAAVVEADSCTNQGTLNNDGVLDFKEFTNDYTGILNNDNYISLDNMTNRGQLTNTDSIIGTYSVWNVGHFDNKSGAVVSLGASIVNGFSGASAEGIFIANGTLTLGDSYYNSDTTQGTTGSITCQDSSYNGGAMLGSFDFCDATPPPTAPFVDYNLGMIDATVTFCTLTPTALVKEEQVVLYPNPTHNVINIKGIEGTYHLSVRNSQGQECLQKNNRNGITTIDLGDLPAGFYFLQIQADQNSQTFKVIKQ